MPVAMGRRVTGAAVQSLSVDDVSWFRRRLMRWQETNARRFPWRETEDPYRILVAEVMLQATFAAKVVPVYEEFIGCYPTAYELSNAFVNGHHTTTRPYWEGVRPVGDREGNRYSLWWICSTG
jgi:adenine-specific DNA glycosylase